MSWGDIALLIALLGLAVFILYRAIRKRTWCPDIYGNGGCSLPKNKEPKKE